MIAGGVAVEEVAAAHLQAAGLGVDESAEGVAWVDAVDVAVGEADFAAAFDAGESDAVRGPHAAKHGAGGEGEWSVVGGLDDDVAVDLRVHKAGACMAEHLHDMHGPIAAIRAAAGDLCVAATLISRGGAGAGDELESGLVIDAETVRQMLPVGAADDEGFALLSPKLRRRTRSAPEGPEVDVLHTTHVDAVVDEKSAIQRCAIEIADEVPARVPPAEIDRLIRIHQQHVDDRAVVRAGEQRADRPRIGDGRIRVRLIGMKYGDTFERRIVIELDERRAARVALATEGEQHRAIRSAFTK